MNKLNLWKTASVVLLASLTVFLFVSSAGAIGGTDLKLKSSDGGAGPDIEVSADGNYLAVAYYKQDSATPGAGAVYLKSASTSYGWVSSTFLGKGSSPQVAFKQTEPGRNTTVYVVWINSTATAIQSARCTLNPTTQPTCVVGNNVRASDAGDLAAPDIVVDGNNYLHVTWQKGLLNSEIETIRSDSPDSVTAWPSTLPPKPGCGGGKAEGPVLGWTSASNQVHLAFLCGSSAAPAKSVEYNRSADSSHTWLPLTSFTIGSTVFDEINTIHSKLGNLAMAAGGSQVSLAWDGKRTDLGSGLSNFGLMSITSQNEGENWPLGSFSNFYVSYVPSGVEASGGPGASEDKVSTTSTLPPQEYGLRPSLVTSGAPGNAAVVWQQKRGDTCTFDESSSSDIFFAGSQTGGTSDTLEHTDSTDYSIDPDLTIGTGGTQHFIFMKDDHAGDCTGGDKTDYAVFYRGPIIDQTYDQGEIGTGDVYLPIVLKQK